MTANNWRCDSPLKLVGNSTGTSSALTPMGGNSGSPVGCIILFFKISSVTNLYPLPRGWYFPTSLMLSLACDSWLPFQQENCQLHPVDPNHLLWSIKIGRRNMSLLTVALKDIVWFFHLLFFFYHNSESSLRAAWDQEQRPMWNRVEISIIDIYINKSQPWSMNKN